MFNTLSEAIRIQAIAMQNQYDTLYVVDISKEELYAAYLAAFPEGTNNLFQERTEHDCNTCKNFIRDFGHVVAIDGDNIVTVWDVIIPDSEYKIVADAMKKLVSSKKIVNVFFHNEHNVGKDSTPAILKDGSSIVFKHFHAPIHKKFYNRDRQNAQHSLRTNAEMFERALTELSGDAIETVIDLIKQNSIYRGEEHLPALTSFIEAKNAYNNAENKELFIWANVKNYTVTRFRNTVIGSLIIDLSDGKDLEKAVKSFESKVAPANYKRPTALITPAMVKNAVAKINELGYQDSLKRRFAHLSDVSINNVLFADHDAAVEMKDALTDMLMKKTKTSAPSFDKVQDIGIEDFIANVIPTATKIEMFVENSHLSNLVSIIAPEIAGSKNILKWDNNFSWAYKDGVTDSMRERVQQAGGRIDGVFRFTHSWNDIEPNQSLMDLHVFLPSHVNHKDGIHDNYGNNERVGWNARKHYKSGGSQDVDYTSAAPAGYIPIENITFPDLKHMEEGTYVCKIHNWAFRNTGGRGKAEIEFDEEIYQYEYPATKNKEWVTIAEVTLKDSKFSIKHILQPSSSSKDAWGISTQQFVPVTAIMLSPNYWDENASGNKHYIFTLKDCKNPEAIRGLYNEFLSPELTEHRKVFEVLGDQMKCEPSDNQLSGLGFSSTKRSSIICKVSGNVSRMLKINF